VIHIAVGKLSALLGSTHAPAACGVGRRLAGQPALRPGTARRTLAIMPRCRCRERGACGGPYRKSGAISSTGLAEAFCERLSMAVGSGTVPAWQAPFGALLWERRCLRRILNSLKSATQAYWVHSNCTRLGAHGTECQIMRRTGWLPCSATWRMATIRKTT